MDQSWQLRVHPAALDPPAAPVLVYLPGLHGDWTLVGPFRAALAGRATFGEVTYARTYRASLSDYADAVFDLLRAQGLAHGWLLAESFGSQVAWAMLAAPRPGFTIRGIILAGGFVRYQPRWLVRLGGRAFERMPARRLQSALRLYVRIVRCLRYRSAAFAEDLAEFLARRTEADKLAAAHRLGLIARADWRPLARQTRLPVFHLAGFFDPVVPPWPVRRWLRRHCPGFRGARLFFASDHNVLNSAPRRAADQVLAWVRAASPGPEPPGRGGPGGPV
jgi:pimeloyl-ACP methyl ester carboxylesterase